jgi:hypothetical protein
VDRGREPSHLLAAGLPSGLGGASLRPISRIERRSGELDAIHVMRGKKKGLRIKAIPAHPTLFDVTS